MSDEAHELGVIAQGLHLDARDSALVQRLRAESSVDHRHGYDRKAIFAVKLELSGPTASAGYAWSTQSRHRLLAGSAPASGPATTRVRHEVNPSTLVDGSHRACARGAYIAATGWKRAF